MAGAGWRERVARLAADRALGNRCPVRVLALLLIVISCSAPKAPSELAGVYVMNQTQAADTLWLRGDNRWVRRYHQRNFFAADSGPWFLASKGRMVGLREFPKRWAFVHDAFFDTTKGRVLVTPTTLGLTIERSWLGKRRLGWHPDWGWWYERVAR
jgi:hypothetical protein